MYRRLLRVGLLLSLVGLAGCVAAAVDVKPVKTTVPAKLKPSAVVKLIQLKRVMVKIPQHAVIGSIQQGPMCLGMEQLFWKSLDKIYLTPEELTDVLHTELTHYNFKVLGGVNQLFEEGSKRRADLVLGALIRDIKGNICYNPPDQRTLASGEAYMRVHWQLYDPRKRKVLFKLTTEGSYTRDLMDLRTDRGRSVWLEAYKAAIANMASNPELQRLVASSRPVAPKPKPKPRPASPAPKYTTPMQIPYASAQGLRLPAQAESVRAAMVGIFGENGSGMGFFISPKGYLLTTARAVKGSRYVKIKLAGSGDLLGEVLRFDPGWDLALVRVKASVAAALPIASGMAKVGSTVYLVGMAGNKPEVRSATVGDYTRVGGRNYLYSAMALPLAMAGSPLVDRHGAVVGIAVALGKPGAKGNNLFVPILEVFKALNLN